MREQTLEEAAEPGIVGECLDCDGQMVETWSSRREDAITLGLVCQDCGGEGRIEYAIAKENPWENPSVQAGVTDTTVEMIAWVDCSRCDGHGWVKDSLCDLCRVMNGREHLCPACHTGGKEPRIVGGGRA